MMHGNVLDRRITSPFTIMSASLPSILCLLAAFTINSVSSLECFKCSNVHLVEGKVNVPSMRSFIYEDNDNPECELAQDPSRLPVVTCPDDVDYFCGYTHAYVTTYAHRVGKSIFHMQVRDCMKYDYSLTSRILPGTKCMADQSTIEKILKPFMPQSVISMHASGRICYCEEDTCVDVIPKSDVIPGLCPDGSFDFANYCLPWWLVWLGVVDAIILAFVGLATCARYFVMPPTPLQFDLPEEETPEATQTETKPETDGQVPTKADSKLQNNNKGNKSKKNKGEGQKSEVKKNR